MGYDDLRELARTQGWRVKTGVVYPDYDEIFRALAEAEPLGFSFVLIGPETIRDRAVEFGLKQYEVVATDTPEGAAHEACRLAASGEIDLLMKGSLSTAILMKAVLNVDSGLRTGRLLSHVAVLECPDGRFLGVTDGGLNIAPSVEQRVDIIHNAIRLFHHIGVTHPRVALLSGVEVVTPAIPSTVEAAELTRIAESGSFGEATVEGPMAFDLAFNPAASRAKHYEGRIRGDADVMVVPEIVSGNILGKALNHAAGYASGGVILGAALPIVLLSRSDRAQEKLNSLLLAASLVATRPEFADG